MIPLFFIAVVFITIITTLSNHHHIFTNAQQQQQQQFNSPTWLQTLLTPDITTNGFSIQQSSTSGSFKASIMGDFNCDGYDDVFLQMEKPNQLQSGGGLHYLLYGTAKTTTTYSQQQQLTAFLANPSPTTMTPNIGLVIEFLLLPTIDVINITPQFGSKDIHNSNVTRQHCQDLFLTVCFVFQLFVFL